MKPNRGRFDFDSPAVYQILIDGRVAQRWAEALGTMTVRATHEGGEKPTVTTVTGVVLDQAGLIGLLTEMYEMHCTLLEVRRLPDEVTSEPGAGAPALKVEGSARQVLAESSVRTCERRDPMSLGPIDFIALEFPGYRLKGAPAPAVAGSDLTAQLQQIAQLHSAGVLTDEEFAAAKKKILAG